MSRLTYKSESGMTWFVDEEGRRLEPCEMSPHHSRLAIEKLARYENLEEAGRLIELPCKVGDYVYKLTTKCDKHKCPPISCEVCDFDEQFVGIRKFKFSYECMYLLEKYLGDTIFLTKAEAEVRLEELKGDA